MKIVWPLLIIVFSLLANEPIERAKMPLEQSLPHLRSIEPLALKVGEGPIKTYVFIDPNCPNSQNFVSLIDENEKMRSKYTYYFFFYELKRFNSADLIAQIYSSNNPIEAMKSVMIRHQTINQSITPTVLGKIAQISKVAETLDVYKRPYLVMVKKEN